MRRTSNQKKQEYHEAKDELGSRPATASELGKSLIYARQNRPTPPQEEWSQQGGRSKTLAIRWAGRADFTRQKAPAVECEYPDKRLEEDGQNLLGKRVEEAATNTLTQKDAIRTRDAHREENTSGTNATRRTKFQRPCRHVTESEKVVVGTTTGPQEQER